jgi:hypothetical protein
MDKPYTYELKRKQGVTNYIGRAFNYSVIFQDTEIFEYTGNEPQILVEAMNMAYEAEYNTGRLKELEDTNKLLKEI